MKTGLTVRIRFLAITMLATAIPPLVMYGLGMYEGREVGLLVVSFMIVLMACSFMALMNARSSDQKNPMDSPEQAPESNPRKSFGRDGWGPTLDAHYGILNSPKQNVSKEIRTDPENPIQDQIDISPEDQVNSKDPDRVIDLNSGLH